MRIGYTTPAMKPNGGTAALAKFSAVLEKLVEFTKAHHNMRRCGRDAYPLSCLSVIPEGPKWSRKHGSCPQPLHPGGKLPDGPGAEGDSAASIDAAKATNDASAEAAAIGAARE